jgi:anhydro-N-acetylmuramic acid kinase
MTPRRWYVGLSSGSSHTGVAAALVRVEGLGTEMAFHAEASAHLPYPRDVRELLLRVAGEPCPGPRQLGLLHRVLGESFANAVRHVVEPARGAGANVLCVGMPGVQIWHDADGRYPSALGLGMAGVVAERTGLTVVTDFVSRDLLVGGQGCPLTALADCLLFRHPREHRVLLHLGGSATLLSIPPDPRLRDVVGLEAGPGTRLLDGLMRLLTGGRESFDPGGKHAVQGCCLDPLLDRWLAHPVLVRRPPRNIPADEFGPDFLTEAVRLARQADGSLHDLLCTATHFVARAVAQSARRFIPGTPARFLVSGGGARNGLLWRLLEEQLAPVPVEKTDAHGIPADARQAVAFAGLAALTMDGVPANLPAATGAAGPRLLGSFTPGHGPNWARCLSWMAAQTAHLHRVAA